MRFSSPRAAKIGSLVALLAAWPTFQAGDHPYDIGDGDDPSGRLADGREAARMARLISAVAPGVTEAPRHAQLLAAIYDNDGLDIDADQADPRFLDLVRRMRAETQAEPTPPPANVLEPPHPPPILRDPPLPRPTILDPSAFPSLPALAPPPPSPQIPTIRRRDPIELPLIEEDGWQEWIVALSLNGQRMSEGALVLRGADDAYALRVSDLRGWRVRIDEDRVITFDGEPFYPLSALPGAEPRLDAADLHLEVDLDAAFYDPTVVAPEGFALPPPVAGTGAFLDYDLQYLAGEGVRNRVDGLVELGLFGDLGVLVGNFRLEDLAGDDRGLTRLETTFIRDVPERRASLRIGDSITGTGALGRPVRFAGVQWASDFSTDPAFVTFPLPSIGGLADQASVVDVLLGNAQRLSERVPPGPFEIDNVPVVTGAGEVQLRVTDLLGRERLVTQPYYVSPRLLRAGLSAYSYEFGLLRERFATDSFAYGDPVAVATHRYGFTDAITGEGHAEILEDLQMLALGGSARLGLAGLVSGGIAGSHERSAGEGWSGSLDYEYIGHPVSVALRTRYSSADFRQLGAGDRPPPRRVDQASLGLSLEDAGRLGFLLLHSDERDGSDRLSLSASYSLRLGPGALMVNALGSFEPRTDYAVTASYSLPLGNARSVTTQASYRDRGSYGRTQLRQGRGASDLGLSWRVAAEAGERPARAEASIAYDASLANTRLDLDHTDGDGRMRANLAGSIAHVDGHTRLSRRLGRAFGLVALPSFSDVRVYLDNREAGRTDAEGMLLLPNLRPYEANRVRIEPGDLPMDAQIASYEATAVPFARAGTTVDLGIQRVRSATATLVDAEGRPLPPGLELATFDGTLSARLGRDGLAYISGVADGAADLAGNRDHRHYLCRVDLGAITETLADLGEMRCDVRG